MRKTECKDCGASFAAQATGAPPKRCAPCKAEWTRQEGSRRSHEWRAANLEHARARDRRTYQRNAEKIRARKLNEHYRYKYGINRADAERMSAEQGGLCLICKRPPDQRSRGGRLHVDHCHATGRVRGLLCGNCNTMIGLANEDPAVLLAAVEYLKE